MKKIVLSLIAVGLLFSFGCSKNDNNSTGNNNENEKQFVESNPVDGKKIFATFSKSNSWTVEPTVNNLVQESDSIARIKVLSKDEPLFFETLDPFPLTPINVEVLEILSGDEISSPTKIYESGGTVSVEKIAKNFDEEKIKKMGIDTLSEEEKATNYIEYSSETQYPLNEGEEYLVILYKQPSNIYLIAAEGYGVFKTNDTINTLSKSKIYNNVLTDEEFSIN